MSNNSKQTLGQEEFDRLLSQIEGDRYSTTVLFRKSKASRAEVANLTIESGRIKVTNGNEDIISDELSDLGRVKVQQGVIYVKKGKELLVFDLSVPEKTDQQLGLEVTRLHGVFKKNGARVSTTLRPVVLATLFVSGFIALFFSPVITAIIVIIGVIYYVKG